MALTDIYAKKGVWDKAESALTKMAQSSRLKHQDFQILSHFFEDRGRFEEAGKALLDSGNAAPAEDVGPLMNLEAYYVRRKAYDKALETMQKAAAIKKDDLNIQAGIAQLHLDLRQFEEAEATGNGILEKDQGHVATNLLKGRLYLS